MIKKYFRTIRKILRYSKWYCQAKIERFNTRYIDAIELDRFESYMILIPHADDEWIGCSQILCKMENVYLVDADMNGGDSQVIHNQRKRELHQIAYKYKRAVFTLMGNKGEELLRLINTLTPRYVVLPFLFDWHLEHIQVMDMLESVLTSSSFSGDILMYQISVPIGERWINRIISMTRREQIDKWIKFKEVYKTQKHLPFFRFLMQERINGKYSNSYASEVYVQMSRERWLALKPYVIKKALNSRENIMKGLNNIRKIRSLSNSISHECR